MPLPATPASVIVVGAGPRVVPLLERLISVARRHGTRVTITVVDPRPAGAGRVWDPAQPGEVLMNSMAQDVTLFPDASCAVPGPVTTGPTFLEWLRSSDAGEARQPEAAPDAFLPRRVMGRYAAWSFARLRATAARDVRVRHVKGRALGLAETPDGRQAVTVRGLGGVRTLVADAVLLSQGHLDVRAPRPAPEPGTARHRRLPPGYAVDRDHARLLGRSTVLARGIGLGFVDDVALLVRAAGGRFEDTVDGLAYRPSGREPVLYAGSRRGVPYHAKWTRELPEPTRPLPDLGATLRDLAGRHGALDWDRDVVPLLDLHLHAAFYAECPEAAGGRLARALDRAAIDGPEAPRSALAGLEETARAVLPPGDLLDLRALDDPLAGATFDTQDRLDDWVAGHLLDDVARRSAPGPNPELALVAELIRVSPAVGEAFRLGLVRPGAASAEGRARFTRFFLFLTSGPPAFRLEQLVALQRAGLLHFLGRGTRVVPGPAGWTASSDSLPDRRQAAEVLLESRHPVPGLADASDPLLTELAYHGRVRAQGPSGLLDTDAAHHVIDRDGHAHPRRLAVGPVTASGNTPVFARPGRDWPVFRHSEAVAVDLLSPAPAVPGPGPGARGERPVLVPRPD